MSNELQIINQKLINRAKTLKNNLYQIIKADKINNPQKLLLIHLMNLEVPLTVKELSEHLKVSERQLRTNLKKLLDEKLIYEIIGNHGLKQYRFGKPKESKDLTNKV